MASSTGFAYWPVSLARVIDWRPQIHETGSVATKSTYFLTSTWQVLHSQQLRGGDDHADRSLQYKAALPHLRKTRGRIVCATSGAGHGALFAGWGFYGTTKAAVAFCISQLRLEEPEVTSIGVSPGLCDTNMIRGLIEGQSKPFISLMSRSTQH